jgi:hypothetical protein
MKKGFVSSFFTTHLREQIKKFITQKYGIEYLFTNDFFYTINYIDTPQAENVKHIGIKINRKFDDSSRSGIRRKITDAIEDT